MHQPARQLTTLLFIIFAISLSSSKITAQEFPLAELVGIWDLEWTIYENTDPNNLIERERKVDDTVISFEMTDKSGGMSIKNYMRSRGAEYLLFNTVCFHDKEKNETHTLSREGKGIITYPSPNIILNTQYHFDGTIRFISRYYHKTDSELLISVQHYHNNEPTKGFSKAVGLKRVMKKGAVQLQIPNR